MFQTGFPSIVRSSKLYVQRQVFVDRYCYLLLTCPDKQQVAVTVYKCLTLYVQFYAPGDGRKTRLKHVERLTEINKL